MFRDLGRVHIVSFAVGIVGLIIGIVGIVLAIVFGTSQTTCTTPVPPTCPPVATIPCNTNLFSIQTGIQNMNWTDAYSNKQSPEYIAAVGNITNNLESSLNAGLNPSSASLIFAVLATSGPSSNNAKVEISDLRKGDDGYTVIAVGNGAISSAKPNSAMPTNVNVTTVIKNDPIYVPSTVNTSSQVCSNTPSDCPVCATCSTPSPVTCSTLPIVVSTSTPMMSTSTANPPTSSSAPTTQPVASSSAAQTTTQSQTTSGVVKTSPVVMTSTSAQAAQTSTKAVITSTPGVTTTNLASTVSSKEPSTSTQAATTSTQAATTSTPAASSSPLPPTTTQGTPSTVATLAPGACYYKSNVAVAFELTNASSTVDMQIENFIANKLFFYNGAPYILGGKSDGKTALSLVPFPTTNLLLPLMSYGAATTSQTITSAIDLFGNMASPNPTISDAFNILPNVSRVGPPGFVILISNSGVVNQPTTDSANALKALGFQIITVGFKSAIAYDTLASQPSYVLKIDQDSDQSPVATQIGNILYTDYCLRSTTIASTVASTSAYQSTSTIGQGTSSVASTTTQQKTSSVSSSTVGTSTSATPQATSPAASTTVTIPAMSTSTTQQKTSSVSSSTVGISTSTTPQATSSAASTTVTIPAMSTSTTQQRTSSVSSSTVGMSTSTTPQASSSAASTTVTASTSVGSSTVIPSVSTSTIAPAASTSTTVPPTPSSTFGSSTSMFKSSSTVSYTTTSGPTPTTCICTTVEPGSTTPGYSTSTFATSMGSSSYSTPASPQGVTSTTGATTSSGATSSPGVPSSTPSVSSSSGFTSSSASTTTQICPNQQTVYKGQVGVVYELLAASDKQAKINTFVENVLLNSNFYGLAIDNLTNDNRTLATAIPYPSTPQYNVQGYGSDRSLDQFKFQVDGFNNAIQPTSTSSGLSDALLYIHTNLPANGQKSSLIIVGSNSSMIDTPSSILANQLMDTFDIYTVSLGDVDFTGISSGPGFSFSGDTQQVADQIAQKMATSSPAVYCPPPVPTTTAPLTSPVITSSTATTTTHVVTTTTVSTARPTVGPCQCTGRWVYNGDFAVAFEFIKNSDGSQNVVNFVNSTLFANSDSYGLANDANGNQPSKLILVPYPDTDPYPIPKYGVIKSNAKINGIIDGYSLIQTASTDPSILDALTYISTNPGNSSRKAIVLVASDGTDVNKATDTATNLKNNGYLVITVAQTASADVFKPLASGDKYALHIGDGADNGVAAQIANLLLDYSFTCWDDGSNNPNPVTRCPSTTMAPGVSTTTLPAGSTVSSTSGSSAPTIGSSSAMTSTISSGSTPSGASTPTPGTTGSNSIMTSTASAGSTTSGASTPAPGTMGSSSVMTSTASAGSTTSGASTPTPGTIGSSSAATSTISSGSTTSGASTPTPGTIGSSSVMTSTVSAGSTISGAFTSTSGVSFSTTGVTGSTMPVGSSSTTPSASSVASSTVTQTILSTTSSLPACDSPFKGQIVTLLELNSVQVEIQNVVNFVSSNLYNSANYDFTTKTTEAINLPYGNTDQYSTNILNFGDALGLGDLQSNIDTLYEQSGLTPSATVSDGLNWLNGNHPNLNSTIIIVAGNHADDNFGLTSQLLKGFRAKQNKFISVAVGETHRDLSNIADKPEWYFQVGQFNGQSVADQISSILCHL